MSLYSKRISSLDLSDIRLFDKDNNLVPMPDLSSLTMRLGDVVLLVALSKDKAYLEVTVTKPKQAISAIKVAL